MSATISVRRLESVPDDATIRDFDEVPDSIKDGIAAAVATGEPSTVASDDRAAIDAVRYTGYYHLDRME